MYSFLLKLFLRQKATLIAFTLLLILGLASIAVGRQFLDLQARNIEDIEERLEYDKQKYYAAHPENIGYMLYYLKFPFVNPTHPLAGVAIGQTDLNNNIEHVTILALEGQKYDTDLVSPIKLQAGNLDLSFVIIFLFPLVVIALTFNLWYEEVETGTWKMIKIQGRSVFDFLLAKFLIRVGLLCALLLLLFIVAKFALNIPLDARWWTMLLLSQLYVLFWSALSLWVVTLKRSSSLNAVVLLSLWLGLTILLPAGINNYVSHKYPVEEAMSLSVKQRDGYHKKWDTDKQETMRRFYECYPQYKHFILTDTGFTWHWYYAMQHMGDLESATERQAMLAKVRQREALSNAIADYLPPIKMQLAMNELARTDLSSYLDFLDETSIFHEQRRLEFYEHIFVDAPSDVIDWSKYKPEFFEPRSDYHPGRMLLGSALLTLFFMAWGLGRLRRF